MKTQLPNDVAPNPPPKTRKPSKAQTPMIKQTILKFSKSIVCRLIKFNEHLEQGTKQEQPAKNTEQSNQNGGRVEALVICVLEELKDLKKEIIELKETETTIELTGFEESYRKLQKVRDQYFLEADRKNQDTREEHRLP